MRARNSHKLTEWEGEEREWEFELLACLLKMVCVHLQVSVQVHDVKVSEYTLGNA